MKLSEYTQNLRAKKMKKSAALVDVKSAVVKEGAKWTVSKQALFDKYWDIPLSVAKIHSDIPKNKKSLLVTSPNKLAEMGQGGDGEQRLNFLINLLKPCKFEKTEWSKYGLHTRKEGSEKRPAQIKQALDLLTHHGFTQTHRMPMSPDFSDLKSSRAVSFYADKYGNSANTVSQKSDNGKNDFYIFNVCQKLTNNDRAKMSSFEADLDKKYNAALEKTNSGLLKQKKGPKTWQMGLKDFIKQMKTNQSVRTNSVSPEDMKEQWIAQIEQALKEGKKLPPEVQEEYTVHTKSVGALFKLAQGTGNSGFSAITLEPDMIRRIKRNLKKDLDVILTAEDGRKFRISTDKTEGSVACDTNLRKSLGVIALYSTPIKRSVK